jgi:tetratricopeptide (TPR) repeat protein
MIRKIAFIALLVIYACGLSDEGEQKSDIQILSEKIAENPTDIDLLYKRVEHNKLNNNLESVLYDLKEIIYLDSLDEKNHNQIAVTYFELSKLPNANPNYPSLVKYYLEKSLMLNDKQASAHALMGELLLAYGKYKEAIGSFNSSLKLEYNQEKTHMLMGYSFKQLKQTENAINCFRNSVNINPDYKEAHVQLGQIFHLIGDTSAVIYYNNALRLSPKDDMILYNKALFYQSKQEWNKALDVYAELHTINAFHSSGHYNLGFIHMELGLYDVAANNFSDAIYSNSEFYEAYYSRGNCFETLGNVAQAESDYKRAIEINPEYTYAIDALESLINMNKNYNK